MKKKSEDSMGFLVELKDLIKKINNDNVEMKDELRILKETWNTK